MPNSTTKMPPRSVFERSRVFILIIGVVLGALIEEIYWFGRPTQLTVADSLGNKTCSDRSLQKHLTRTAGPDISIDFQTEDEEIILRGKPFTRSLRKFHVISTAKSRFYLRENGKNPPPAFKGQILNVTIDTYDAYGRQRTEGGDFFFAVMSNTKLQKSTAGRIVDHNNGSYTVQFYAGWAGPASIVITLVHPREAVNWIETVYRPKERCIDWNASFKNHNTTEESTCYVFRGATLKNKCVYSNENALGKTEFVCDSPKHLSCDDISTVKSDMRTLVTYVQHSLSDEEDFLFKKPYLMTPLAGSPMKIEIKEPKSENKFARLLPGALRPCGPDLPMPISDGFWESTTKWTSLACMARHWNADQIIQCAHGKSFVIIGDSTTRQWHAAITKKLKLKLEGGKLLQRSEGSSQNISATFHFHAVVVGSAVIDFWKQRFESDIIDNITDSQCNSVIVLSVSYHFASWTKDSYEERLFRIRLAIIRLRKRCQDIIIVVKSAHPRDHRGMEAYIHSSDWTLYDMNRKMRESFRGLGVNFVDIYDMSLAHFAKNNVHMPVDTVIPQQVDLLFSYICPNLQ
ncbi:NXPE family member 4-like [Ptychodera flava]|uniref:NXPE family member 4-like n=1 Tax=Ptychodera flava TaxID=63121 RepID=UPI003969C5D7